eukprot:scaffold158_cov388-Prasinococcus_capsulatus_cf.AAC.10
MNVAPTKGFEDKVGRKTTFRLLNNKHATAISRGHELAIDLERGINLIVRTSDSRMSSRLEKVLARKDPRMKLVRLNMKVVDELRSLLDTFKTCHGEHGHSFSGGETPSAGTVA